YGAVSYFGVTTFTTGIFRAWFSLGDLDTAIRLSASLMVMVLLLLGLERWHRGSARYDEGSVNARAAARYSLRGVSAFAAMICCALPLFFGFILPVLQLVLWTMQLGARALNVELLQLAWNSFALALGAAVLCV